MDSIAPVKTHSHTSMAELKAQTWTFVEKYMSQPSFDCSHDFNHVKRVYRLALQIYETSEPLFKSRLNVEIIALLALLHDVGDKKYASSTSTPELETPPRGAVEEFLLSIDAPENLATHLQKLVSNVSFSNEQKNRTSVLALAAQYPELVVVQDADRIDAIGAIGIARVITYGMIKKPEEGWKGIATHYGEKLGRLAAEMKTEVGRKIAEERGERLRVFFEEWWNDEVG